MNAPDVKTRVFVSEVFLSLQGEGVLAGMPSWFVRVSGCNLRCGFCDTPYTSWEARGEHRTVAQLFAQIQTAPQVRHVVVTGGEPAIVRGTVSLCEVLRRNGYHVTVETAGTVYDPQLQADLYSVSPKLANSTPDDPAWRERHEATRIDLDALTAFVRTGAYQLKFVVSSADDLRELDALVAKLGAAPERVLLMPEGTDVAQIDAVAHWLGPECIRRGYRFCDRLHVRLYGDTPGT